MRAGDGSGAAGAEALLARRKVLAQVGFEALRAGFGVGVRVVHEGWLDRWMDNVVVDFGFTVEV